VIAIILLSGNGNFCTCRNRKGEGAKLIHPVAGDLLLIRAPGLMDKKLGPLHFVREITQKRRTIGFRYDAKKVGRNIN
jgi:hypothetical protein